MEKEIKTQRVASTPRLSSTSCQQRHSDLHQCTLRFFRPIHKGAPNMQHLIIQRMIARKAYTPNHFKAEPKPFNQIEISKSNTIKAFLDGISSSSAKIHPVILSPKRKSRVVKIEDVTKNLFQQNRFKNLMSNKHANAFRMKKRLLCMGKAYSDKTQKSLNEKSSSPLQNQRDHNLIEASGCIGSAQRLNTVRNSMVFLPQCIIKSFGNVKRQSAPPNAINTEVKSNAIISSTQDSGDTKRLVSIGIETDRKSNRILPLLY